MCVTDLVPRHIWQMSTLSCLCLHVYINKFQSLSMDISIDSWVAASKTGNGCSHLEDFKFILLGIGVMSIPLVILSISSRNVL